MELKGVIIAVAPTTVVICFTCSHLARELLSEARVKAGRRGEDLRITTWQWSGGEAK